MTPRRWLQRLRDLGASARRRLLYGLFRRTLAPLASAAVSAGAGSAASEGRDQTFRMDDCAVRLISTNSARAGEAGGFPLAPYWSGVREGFGAAHAWAHYGVASRRASLEWLRALTGEGGVEDETVFVLSCVRDPPRAGDR